ncbi:MULTISPECIES: glycosyltransferase family A protein [Paenibacillus]|uniref:glycosyltransferase family A protein n=1 Tax=Paenibacillus TaxID=44249 RepID=UPI00096DD8D8|nr:glycosyltransferase family A protein [Paenibacillus odorifer]OME27869.1 hypothetical protein BSK57_04500 [Paenibacillus odorifer]
MLTRSSFIVVTPTYNRAYTLDKCYESLKRQTYKSFIWMIVDDGSTDNTEKLVEQWISEKKIEIRYFRKKNGGKASALNFSLDRVNTKTSDYIVCLDSDDTFADNALEIAENQLSQIKKKSKYCGMVALRTSPNGEVLGGKQIPDRIKETTLSEICNELNIRSELICFYKTEVICQYRFPEIDGEKFISPAYIQYEVSKTYKYIVSQNVICYCEYLSDGLTKNKREVIKNNPRGYTLVKRQSFEQAKNFKSKSKHCLMYIAGCILSNDKDCIKKSPHRRMTMLYYPLGWLAYKIRFRSTL